MRFQSDGIEKFVVAFLSIQAAIAAPSTTDDVQSVKRQSWNLSPCYAGGVLGNGSPMTAARNFQYTAAPWFPNCVAIPSQQGEIECLACTGVAGAAYYLALTGCTAGSAACAVGAWACESVCVAVATYALWAAEQACYCEHANCSDAAQRNSGRIGGPPRLNIGGQLFNLPLPSGWGYVGTRSVNITPLGRPFVATTCSRS